MLTWWDFYLLIITIVFCFDNSHSQPCQTHSNGRKKYYYCQNGNNYILSDYTDDIRDPTIYMDCTKNVEESKSSNKPMLATVPNMKNVKVIARYCTLDLFQILVNFESSLKEIQDLRMQKISNLLEFPGKLDKIFPNLKGFFR